MLVYVLQRALGEFPEKEIQLHQTEIQGEGVLARTSEEGRVHIRRDLQRLKESWTSLHTLSLNLYRSATSSLRVQQLGQDRPEDRFSRVLFFYSGVFPMVPQVKGQRSLQRSKETIFFTIPLASYYRIVV